jgi:hypothetical protein
MSERKLNAVTQSAGNLRFSLWHVMFSRAEIPVTFLLRMLPTRKFGIVPHSRSHSHLSLGYGKYRTRIS